MVAPPSTAQPVTVMSAFVRRDPDAVRSLYHEYGRLVYAVALRILRRPELAEEATQQTFVRAWQAADRFDVGRDPGPWLATIARRIAIDVHRYEARREALPFGAVEPAAPDGTPLELVWDVRRAIDALPDDEATVLRLQHLEGLSQAEIAEQLGLALGTVKSRSFRAHRKLATRLADLRAGVA